MGELLRGWRRRPPGWSGVRWTSPAGIGLLAAFMLPILVLAVVSIVSIRQRSETRRLLVEETYAGVADLATTKLDESMEEWDRELLDKLDSGGWNERDVIERLHEAEHAFPSLRPLVMLAPDGRIVYPLRARDDRSLPMLSTELVRSLLPSGGSFAWLLDRGQEAELAAVDYDQAIRLYRRASGASASTTDRARALNAMARTQVKAARPLEAAATYTRIVELADPLDPELARWAVIGRLQGSAALYATGDTEAACDSRFEALEFLVNHRFNLDPDLYAFYRDVAERAVREHELDAQQKERLAKVLDNDPELERIDAALTLLVRQAPRLAAADAVAWLGAAAVASGMASDAETDPDAVARLAPEWTISYLNLQSDASGSTVVASRGEQGWRLVRRWRPESVEKVLYWVLEQAGPWRRQGIALIDPDGAIAFASTERPPSRDEYVAARLDLRAFPGWHVAAYPRAGTLSGQARQDVFDYAVLLGAAFLAVVGGLLLATRTISREVALARTRSDFVSNVSHELKTPLSLIRMFAENLKAGWVPDTKKPEYYQVMLGESERLSGVIDNVLDFSRIESGRREFRLRPVDLTELVSELLDRYRYSLETAGIELTIDLPDGPVVARVDREGIAQVLVNLLSNAAKYIGEGERRITVSLQPDNGEVRFAVADSGVGMTESDIDEIFAPFCRLDDPQVTAVAGSGIGLTIVRHIVDAHRGRVVVESAPQAGSTFTVVIPRDPEAPDVDDPPEPDDATSDRR